MLRDGLLALPPDDLLIAELLAVTYTLDNRGRSKIDSKRELRAVLGRSPDRLDAVAMAVAATSGIGAAADCPAG